jgi:site-specific DNA-cytosine methylase
MIARCEPECFHRAIYYIKNLSHKQGHNRKENVIVSTEKIRKTGGNNVPLVEQEADAICIAGNTVDRQPQNGGNGLGCQDDLAYTLTATDRHAVYSRQRVDDFRHNDVASTQSARQYKDATDLICQQAEACAHLIRRLTPLECERLQGFPDGWTDIPGASDSARYKALGNSVYLIMVVMRRTDVKTAPGEDSWRSCFT